MSISCLLSRKEASPRVLFISDRLEDYENINLIKDYHEKIATKQSLQHKFDSIPEFWDYISGNTRLHLIDTNHLIICSMKDPVME